MKVTFRLPSKAVQYGYVEFETEVDGVEHAEPDKIGKLYADAVKLFWQGEKGISTPDPDSDAVAEFEKQLGATKVPSTVDKNNGSTTPPWENKKTESSPKPWESSGTDDLFG